MKLRIFIFIFFQIFHYLKRNILHTCDRLNTVRVFFFRALPVFPSVGKKQNIQSG